MKRKIIHWFCYFVSVGLMIASFVIPPTGVIDPSVLEASGILIGGIAIIDSINSNREVEINIGNFKFKSNKKQEE